MYFYEADPNTYRKLLMHSLTSQYRKCDELEELRINKNASGIAKELCIDDRTKRFSRQEAFITLKDHKSDFRTNPSTRLINPAKTDIGRVSKKILDRITSDIRNARSEGESALIQWRNTTEVLEWFKNANKNNAAFIQFDIEQYYPSITEGLLNRALNFAREFTEVSESDEKIILHSKNSLLFCDNSIWQKKNGSFDVTMGSWDGAETSDLVGLYLLNKLLQVFPTGTFGLYRDDGLAIAENADGPKVERLRKNIIRTFKTEGLKVTVDTKAKAVDFLDVTLDLTDNSHQPYRKGNNEILYVNSNSNHPPKIKENIPDMIGKRISNLSSDDTKFNKTVKTYQDALHSSGYKQKLKFLKEAPLANPKKKRQRRRKVIWFTPPFSNQVRGNIGRKFLQLLDSHFYPGHPLSKLFNRKTIKISYSTLPNIGQIISAHNRKILSNTTTTTTEPERTCNCRQKNDCPLDGNCLKSGIVYEAVITTPSETFSYIGLTEGKFKTRYSNHKHSFKNPSKKTSTELAKKIWDLKDHSTPYQIAWKIADHGHAATEASKTCDLCTTEKLLILKNRTRTDITPSTRSPN